MEGFPGLTSACSGERVSDLDDVAGSQADASF
jgi:hypothetical protein